MSTPFIGQIQCFSFEDAPSGWAKCDGQEVSVITYADLFALISTTYGGDGIDTFALPDLRSRFSLHIGQGPGLSSYSLADNGGAEEITLATGNLPSHNHSLEASSGTKLFASPAGASLGGATIYTAAARDSTLSSGSIGMTGSGDPAASLPPYLAVNWCIALEGTVPTFN